MKPRYSNVVAIASVAVCCWNLATPVRSQSTPSPTPELVKPQPTPTVGTDETNSSPRERGRILVKLNPIASEYQIFGDIGTSPGADSDAEGVDYRSFFPAVNPATDANDALLVGVNTNYNDLSSKTKSGYNLQLSKVLDREKRWALALQLRSSASERLIEHYESVWRKGKDDGLLSLDRPRFSFDEIQTRNNVATAQIGFLASDRFSFYFKSFYQDYYDYSYRNRLELQFGNAKRVEGSETINPDSIITNARYEGARTRRYFGDTENERTRQHNTFGGTYKGDNWTVDYSVYSQKWDLDTLWYDWNFSDKGLDISYAIDDPYKPEITEHGDTDLLDISEADLSSVRIHNSYTRDRDLAARIDADRSILLGDREIWIQTGFLHREKKRNTWEDRDVLMPNPEETTLALPDVAYETDGTDILDGYFTMPAGLDPQKARSVLSNDPQYFTLDSYQSRIESAPQSYTTSEFVSSAYFLGTNQIGDWTLEVGGRLERTKTETRGTVVIPEQVNDPAEGEFIEEIVNPNDQSVSIIKNLYSENSYDNFIPTAEVSFDATPESTLRLAWFQLLMRPQYYNIVDYRRVSVPTQSISEGNPNLKPTEIDKFRLSWTKENDTLGSLSVEAYLINVENFFYGSVSEETILEDGTPTLYRVSRVENGGEASIHGFEVQWTKSFSDFTVFDSSSVQLAYTFSDSDATVETRPQDILPTPERSDHLLKLRLNGRIGKLNSSIEFAYQSEALDNLGSSYDQDAYREDVINVSFSSRYRLTDKVTLTLDLANLTDHPERSYEDSPLRVTRNQYSSWFGTLGLTRSF